MDFLIQIRVHVTGLEKDLQNEKKVSNVLPAKSDSDVMFCLHSYHDLESIDHLCINP